MTALTVHDNVLFSSANDHSVRAWEAGSGKPSGQSRGQRQEKRQEQLTRKEGSYGGDNLCAVDFVVRLWNNNEGKFPVEIRDQDP